MEQEKLENLINDFVENQVFLMKYSKADNVISPNYDAKMTVKLGKKIAKMVKKIIENNGVDDFLKLLDSEDLYTQAAAAQYLYPVEPKKCIEILKSYSASLKDELDKLKVDDMIKGFESKNQFFMNLFADLYGKEM